MESQLSLTGRRWQWPDSLPSPASDGQLPGWMLQLVTRRGLCAPDEIASYLSPSLQSLADPSMMADMGVALTRLVRAIRDGESITVYGDYDVDGVCSTTVLVEFLQRVGARVTFYIPDRRSEGYGLNLAAVEGIAKTSTVLITADCGITAHAEVAAARAAGLDVIIVDHHKVPATLPDAVAALNPQRPDCAFPFKGLCAAGVAFMLVMALRRALRDSGHFTNIQEPDVRELLDVVALATVADMVPLRGINRTLVTAGLKRIGQTRRPGLQALLEVAEVDPSQVTASDVGFRLGPRINARGRLAHAAEAVELMLTGDLQRARMLAAALDVANRERRAVERSTADAAFAQVEALSLADQHAALVVHDAGWHPGVLGLVASRLVSRYRRPAVVIGEGGKGSARSIEGLNIHDAIAENGAHLVRFGGHHAAAGVTIATDSVEAFRSGLDTSVRSVLGAPPFIGLVRLDLEVAPRELSLRMVDDLQRLSPFGQDNPEPLLVSRGMQVRDRRIVGDGHLKLSLAGEGGVVIDAIGFGLGKINDGLPQSIDAAFRLSRNVYRGRESVQMELEDARPAA